MKIITVGHYEVETDALNGFEELEKKLKELDGYRFKSISLDDEMYKYISKYGVTSVLNPTYLEFLGTPHDTNGTFIRVLHEFLDQIVISDQLTIIDSYFFPRRHDDDYLSFVMRILEKYFSDLNNLTIVTRSDHNNDLQAEFFGMVQERNQDLDVELVLRDDYHDRFWISSPNDRGLFMGTSLNGLGRKFSLIDYIDVDDVREIFAGLE